MGAQSYSATTATAFGFNRARSHLASCIFAALRFGAVGASVSWPWQRLCQLAPWLRGCTPNCSFQRTRYARR
jgi:hypothetical protein